MTKELRCTNQELIDWLINKLDDCPCEWHTNDYYCDEGVSIIFETEEELEGESIKEAALSDKYMIEGDDNAYINHDYRKGEGV